MGVVIEKSRNRNTQNRLRKKKKMINVVLALLYVLKGVRDMAPKFKIAIKHLRSFDCYHIQ